MSICSRLCLGTLLALLLACSSSTPPLDVQSTTLTLSVSPDHIDNLGQTSQLRLRAFKSDGTPAFDGSRVFLEASGDGSLTSEVILQNGEATAVYTSGATTGTVTITATSGTLSASKTITVTDSFVAAGVVTFSQNPNNLGEAGGRVDLTISVRDSVGVPIPGKPVLFSSDRGLLASNGQPRTSDSNGLAHDVLTLSPRDLLPAVTAVNVSALVDAKSYAGTVSITANASPTPSFSTSPADLVEDQPVHFSATGSADSDGEIVAYRWQFGDGETGQGVTTQHTYAAAGTYTVILEVTDNQGASASKSGTVTIASATPNASPVAAFNWSPSSALALQPLVFDASASSDSDGSIVSYHWTFGDSLTVFSGQRVTHIYAGADTYEVTLTVTDDDGATNLLSQTITVTGNVLPTASFTTSATALNRGASLVLDAAASADTDGSIVGYHWDFGDGTRQDVSVPAINHIYNQVGTFTIYLTVTDNTGGQGFANATVTVSDVVNSAPAAAFTFTPAKPTTAEPVIFDGSTSTDDTAVASYLWDFGDGRKGSGKIIAHRYDQAGTYPAKLTVFDAEDASDTTIQDVPVVVSGAPVPKLTVTLLDTLSLILDATGTTDDEDDITELKFQFDGYAPGDILLNVDSGTGPVRQAEISTTQTTFTVYFVVTVTDTDGNSAQVTESYSFTESTKRGTAAAQDAILSRPEGGEEP